MSKSLRQVLNYYPSLFLLPVLFFIFVAISQGDAAAVPVNSTTIDGNTVIPLSGLWQFKAGDINETANQIAKKTGNWGDIRVPSNWYLEGHDISGIAWYSKKFTLPADYVNKSVKLKFSGVDYITEVWLNGHYIGHHEGYFQPFQFDITHALVFNKENHLLVKVNSPLETMVQDWSLHKQYIKGIFGHHDTRPGGAWSDRGQEMNTGGIWAPVNLEVHNVAAIETVKVVPTLNVAAKSAMATIQMGLVLQQKSPLPVNVTFNVTPHNFLSTQSFAKDSTQTLTQVYNSIAIPLKVNNPELWWPWDQGNPNLYKLEIKVIAGNQLLDKKTVTFGFRSVQFDKTKNEWRINGRRLFLRGTNYIATQWLSEMSPDRFAQDITLMKSANINVVRVHAHVTSEDYYRLCDEMGLLNWQDFPLQWGYKDDDAFTQNAVRQARDMVNYLYNHPSIIAWSLINEPAWDATWMKTKYKHYNKLQNKTLTDKLYQSIYPLDNTRYVHPYSASGEHPWLGWYSGSWVDYNKPTKIGLVAEFGAQALPNINALRRIFEEKDLWPITDQQWDLWEFHNFRRKETFKYAKIAMGSTLAEFIKNTQAYQAKLIKLAAESYRRQRYQPVSAIFQFMFCEDWPSMNWGIMDYWRSPKQGYFALKQAYQPVLPSIKWEKEYFKTGENADFELWVVNDLPTKFPDAAITYSLKRGKSLLESHQLNQDIAADNGEPLKRVAWQDLTPGHYELVVTVADSQGKTLGVNSHEFDITP